MKEKAYVRKLNALWYGVNELLNRGERVVAPDELREVVSTAYVTKVLKKDRKRSEMVYGGKARYTKSLIKIGETIGLLKQREDGLIVIKPMDEYTFNVLAGIFLGNVGREGGIAVWENKRMLEDVVACTKKRVMTVEEFTRALLISGWARKRTPPHVLKVIVERVIIEMLGQGLIEFDNKTIKVKLDEGVTKQFSGRVLPQLERYRRKLVLLAREFGGDLADGREFAKKFKEVVRVGELQYARLISRYFGRRGYIFVRGGMVDISRLRALDK